MRKFLQRLLTGPIIRLANKYSSRPDQQRVHEALTTLFNKIQKEPGKRGQLIDFDPSAKLIIFSDQHKGSRNYSDDFALSEKNYLAALRYYNGQNYLFCSLGDSEELWEKYASRCHQEQQSYF
jgi:hypothetical protein